jgi:putative ABC transport system substrate-binding protein
MKKRIIGFALSAMLFALSVSAQAQQAKKVPRIGYLSATADQKREAFLQGLRALGYVEGKNIVIEYRWLEGKTEPIPDLTAELVRLNVDVIVTGSTLVAQAARKLTTTIPIVVVGVGDPVGTGLVASLAHPGGNVTGLSGLAPELSGKRLELLKEAFPKVSRVGVFWNPASPSNALNWKETEAAGRAAAVKLQSLEVRSPDDFERAFRGTTKERVNAFIVIRDNVTNVGKQKIIAFAAKHRLPAMYPDTEYVENGGLMSYAPDFLDIFRRAATHVDKILKGTKPADLPVEQPMKFEFVVNLKTANQTALTVPPNVLVRANRVIR